MSRARTFDRGSVRVDLYDEHTAVSRDDFDDRVVQYIQGFTNPHYSHRWFADEVQLEAPSVEALRNWHAERVAALDHEMSGGPPELVNAAIEGVEHVELIVEVLERLYRLERLESVEPSPLTGDEIHYMRIDAVRSLDRARELIDELDWELDRQVQR